MALLPVIISAPCPPVRESCPVPPTSLKAFELPVALATEIVTLDPSAAVKTALFASVELFCVADVAVNPLIPVAFSVAPEAIITTSLSEPEDPPRSVTVSVPESIVIISSPSPPVMISAPAPPEIVSIPAFPTIVSPLLAPVIISAPAPPLSVSAPSPPTILKAFELPVARETSIVRPPPSFAFKTALFALVELF